MSDGFVFPIVGLADLVHSAYGIEAPVLRAVCTDTGHLFRVTKGESEMLLCLLLDPEKKIRGEQVACRIRWERRHCFPTPPLFRTADGKEYVRHGPWLVFLRAFPNGLPAEGDRLPEGGYAVCGELLGRLHRLLEAVPLPVDMGEECLQFLTPESTEAEYDRLLRAASSEYGLHRKNLFDDLLYRRGLAARTERCRRALVGLTECIAHGEGDEYCFWYDRAAGRISAVTGFPDCRILPNDWEIVRVFLRIFDSCGTSTTFSVEAFCSFVRAYLTAYPLTIRDLAAMPYYYLYRTARSVRAHEACLAGGADRADLCRRFQWESTICRVLEREKEQITRALLLLYTNGKNGNTDRIQ